MIAEEVVETEETAEAETEEVEEEEETETEMEVIDVEVVEEMIGKYNHNLINAHISILSIDEVEVPYKKTEDSVTIVKMEAETMKEEVIE